MVNVMFTEELYKDLIKYKNIYKNMVKTKVELTKFIFKDKNEKHSTGHELEERIYDMIGGYTIGSHVETLEKDLEMYTSGMERLQNKYPELDLRYLTELKESPYKTFAYNYYVYAVKQKDGDLQYIAENSETGAKRKYDTKDGLIAEFTEMYGYLHKEKTQEGIVWYFEEKFKYVD